MSEPPAAAQGAKGSVEVVELTQAQTSFARRVAESKATAPHVYFTHPVERQAELGPLIAACAAALGEVPLLNSAYRDGHVELYSRVNVAFAVEADGTLVFPVIHDAGQRDAAAITAQIEELTTAAHEATLTAPALAGGTFTVVDMSAGGVAAFSPVLARGQSATLGAGTDALTLACDNRIVQGSEGARFLAHLCRSLDR